jgi:hypothetical protein
MLITYVQLTPQITGDKKQSEAALFGVRVNLPCYLFHLTVSLLIRLRNLPSYKFRNLS